MKDRNLETPTAVGSDSATVFCAIELSKRSWVVAVATAQSRKVSLYDLAAKDVAGLLAVLGRHRGRLARPYGGAVRVMSCFEAGYDGFWEMRGHST